MANLKKMKAEPRGSEERGKPPSEAHISEYTWSVQGTWSGDAMDNVSKEAMTVLPGRRLNFKPLRRGVSTKESYASAT